MRNRKTILVLVIAACAAVASGAIASRTFMPPPLAAKVAPFVLKALETNTNIPILVKLTDQADLSGMEDTSLDREERIQQVYDTLRELAMESQADLVDTLQSRGVKYRRFYIYNMVAVWGANAELVEELASRTDVEKIYGNPSVEMKKPLAPLAALEAFLRSDTQTPVGDNIAFMNADKIWSQFGKAGDGIVIAGQDSGVEWDHPALVNQYRGGNGATVDHNYSWHDAIHKDTPIATNDCGYDLSSPCDDGDHGSHTMGTMVGSDGGENQIGMAPRAKWIACRNMDGGVGTPASYLECFEWLLAPYAYGADPMKDGNPALAPHIINNSWGCPTEEGCTGDEVIPALKAMKVAGILVVVSAGNDGPGCGTIQDPPAWHSALTFGVGAYDHRSGTIASFSSRGPSSFDNEIGPDLVAPGVSIRSSVRGKRYEGGMWSGTSMAGPHVAGAVALLWSIHPELIGDIDATAELLRKTATPKTTTQACGGLAGSAVPNNTYGYGVMDPVRAIESFRDGEIPQPDDAPAPTPDTPREEEPSSAWPAFRRKAS
jgi:subtilisin family serine protease